MSAINPDEIISILKEEIKNYDEISKDQEVGTVISVGDGIATVYGIDHAMYGEVVTFENGLKGMVQDVRANSMGCILFGKDTGIKEGTYGSLCPASCLLLLIIEIYRFRSLLMIFR